MLNSGPFLFLSAAAKLPLLRPEHLDQTQLRSAGFMRLAPLPPPVIQFVFRHLSAQGIAMDSQKLCRPALIAVGSLQNPLDEALFEFTDGFIEQYSALHHLSHKAFQLISHVRTLRDCEFS
jgi:hypothetical protein